MDLHGEKFLRGVKSGKRLFGLNEWLVKLVDWSAEGL